MHAYLCKIPSTLKEFRHKNPPQPCHQGMVKCSETGVGLTGIRACVHIVQAPIP
jgi:hypothetical protein